MKQNLFLLSLLFLSLQSLAQKRFITINESKIWINTIGIEERKEGQPVIVFESGFGTPMDNWERVLADSTNLGPIITYDRPGIGKSEPVEEIPNIKKVADRLIKILDHLELEPPYVLVGHSLGGVLVRGFAVHYPEKLAGLVIVDPGDFTETQINKREYYQVLNWDDKRIDQEIADIDQKFKKRREGMPPALQRESKILQHLRKTDFKEIMESPLPNIPVHILVGGRFDMPQSMRSDEYDSEALFRSKMRIRVSRWTDVIQSVDRGMLLYSGDAGHFVHWDDPELAISSIKLVLKDYREMK
ncbi:MAG: alpha/beta hydrolase [Bacteroidota bacterium]